MSDLVSQTADMLAVLPEEEVSLINSLVKKLVRAWDPDFTKLTPEEKRALEEADKEMDAGDFVSEDEVFR